MFQRYYSILRYVGDTVMQYQSYRGFKVSYQMFSTV